MRLLLDTHLLAVGCPTASCNGQITMKPPWTMQLASDVIRDGLGLELLDGLGDTAAEVFRCDADCSVTVRIFDDGVPDDVIAELVDHARHCLSPFEDGTPLPVSFTVEPAE
jgi:hypothetical protein